MTKRRKTAIYLVLILVACITIFPFIWMVINSFNTEENIFRVPPSFIPDKLFEKDMFENYLVVLRDYHFLRYTFNSIFVATSAALGQVFTCSLAGFAFARMKFKGSNLVFGALLATMMVPVQVTIIPEFLLMMNLGWLDTFAPLIIPSFLVGSFGTFMYKEHYENIPKDLEDAAVIDGAGPFNMFFRVFFPLSKVQSVTLFIVAFMNNWNDLLRPVLYINSTKLMTVTMALTHFQSQYSARWNYLLTGAVLSILPLMIVFILLQRFVIEGVTHTGIKG
ncbi:MAG: carbohydrate ABC transporter permease [Kosmotoga sp.]|jgi:multiple sugar transport system permease protein|nr:MAG: carbohydrate ABC transporter permease [Kosmotoga sp.]